MITIKKNAVQCVCVAVLLLTPLGTSLQLNWLFHGKQDMKYSAIITMISRLGSLIAIFVFVKESKDIYLYCLIYALAPVLGNILSIIVAKIKYRVKFVKVSYKDIFSTLKDGWYVFTTQLSSKVFSGIGITFMGIFATAYETGIYSTIQKIPYILTLVWAPIGQVLYPTLSKKYDASFENGVRYVKKLTGLSLGVFSAVVLGISVFSKPIISIVFGSEYASFFYLIYPQLIWTLFGILNNFLGIQILLASGHDEVYARCFYVGVVLNVAVNFVLIYIFKGLGASIAPLCSEAALSLLMLYQIRNIKNENSEINSIIKNYDE